MSKLSKIQWFDLESQWYLKVKVRCSLITLEQNPGLLYSDLIYSGDTTMSWMIGHRMQMKSVSPHKISLKSGLKLLREIARKRIFFCINNAYEFVNNQGTKLSWIVRPGNGNDMRISSQYWMFTQFFIGIRIEVSEKSNRNEIRTTWRTEGRMFLFFRFMSYFYCSIFCFLMS